MTVIAKLMDTAELAPADDSTKLDAWKIEDGDLSAAVEGYEIRSLEGRRLTLWKQREGDQSHICVSSAVWLRGLARNTDGSEWSAVIDFIDLDGQLRRWLMPRELLAGERAELLRQFLSRGLHLFNSKDARDAFSRYVAGIPNTRFTTTTTTGWNGESFVLPTETVGNGNFILANPPSDTTPPAGTLEGWREHVAMRCQGNTRLQFSLSVSLTSPLLRLDNAESGGLNYLGGSSLGKTTALRVAGSVWGGRLESWRATDNALEGVAARHNDVGLVLDEIGQVDGKVVGEVAYMLANGQGKGRSARDGTDKPRQTWRLLFLSTGETTLAAHMREAGKKPKTGQELRLVNIKADAGAGLGLFEDCHGLAPSDFADTLTGACAAHHGHAGPEFVRQLVADTDHARSVIASTRERFDKLTDLASADGQVQRVGRRFALVAAAGELATEYGLTGWQPGTGLDGAVVCFTTWRSSWTPAGAREDEQAIQQVRTFLHSHASRLDPFDLARDDDVETRTRDRAGFVRKHADGTEYLIFPRIFDTEVCAGLEPNAVRKALAERGLIRTSGGKNSVSIRPESMPKKTRFVAILDAIHEDGAEDAAGGDS